MVLQGAELVSVPLEVGQKKALMQAFRGAQGAFLMTPPVLPPATHEVAIGKEQADAAVEAGVQHVIFSGLENVDKITGGKKWAPHFTDKAIIEEYIRELPVLASFVYLSFFYTNLVEYYPPRMERDVLVFPIYLPGNFRAPFVDPLTATGPAAREIFDHPQEYRGKSMPIVGEFLTPEEMVETFVRVTGRAAVYTSSYTRDGLLQNFPAFGANEALIRELLGMAEFAVEYGYFRKGRDVGWSRRINPNTLTWEKFLREGQWRGQTFRYSAA